MIEQIAVTNLSDRKQWLEPGTVLGKVTEVEEVADEDTTVATIAVGEEEKAHAHDFDSKICDDLGAENRESIGQVLREFEDCFAEKGERLGLCSAAEHVIDTGDAKPIRQAPRAAAWKERIIVEKQC